MAIQEYLEAAPHLPIVPLPAESSYSQDSISFLGTLRHHPYDTKKVLLVSIEKHNLNTFYEFRAEDVLHVERLPQIVSANGDSVEQIRLWMRKGCFGIEMRPFVVGEANAEGVDTNQLYG